MSLHRAVPVYTVKMPHCWKSHVTAQLCQFINQACTKQMATRYQLFRYTICRYQITKYLECSHLTTGCQAYGYLTHRYQETDCPDTKLSTLSTLWLSTCSKPTSETRFQRTNPTGPDENIPKLCTISCISYSINWTATQTTNTSNKLYIVEIA